MTDRERHRNDERKIACPIEECDAEVLARGINLHVRQSAGGGHGPQGEVPDHISFEDLERVGEEAVEMHYPAERDTEQVTRLCPYCLTPFTGKQGVLIHLGQVEGRKNHPSDATSRHHPDDFPRVTVDHQENVVEVVEDQVSGSDDSPGGPRIPESRVYRYIASLLANDEPVAAQRARRQLLGDDE
jgi:hypothetical protein